MHRKSLRKWLGLPLLLTLRSGCSGGSSFGVWVAMGQEYSACTSEQQNGHRAVLVSSAVGFKLKWSRLESNGHRG